MFVNNIRYRIFSMLRYYHNTIFPSRIKKVMENISINIIGYKIKK